TRSIQSGELVVPAPRLVTVQVSVISAGLPIDRAGAANELTTKSAAAGSGGGEPLSSRKLNVPVGSSGALPIWSTVRVYVPVAGSYAMVRLVVWPEKSALPLGDFSVKPMRLASSQIR